MQTQNFVASGADVGALLAAYELSERFTGSSDMHSDQDVDAVRALVSHAAFVSAIACSLSEESATQVDYSQAFREFECSFATVSDLLAERVDTAQTGQVPTGRLKTIPAPEASSTSLRDNVQADLFASLRDSVEAGVRDTLCRELRETLLDTSGLLEDLRGQLLHDLRTTLALELCDELIADRREPLVNILAPPLFETLAPKLATWLTEPLNKIVRAATDAMVKDVTPRVQSALHTPLQNDLLAPLHSKLEAPLLDPLAVRVAERLASQQIPPDNRSVSHSCNPQVVETTFLDVMSAPSGFSAHGSFMSRYRRNTTGDTSKRKRVE
ncbi:hypothetical protein C8Q80DRAFT_1271917 [Daedaleopsis nitida]|nr:hypothetical protein C8Q80DRAFT_1271917 [Daedaleopsis nitida]